MFDNNKLGEIRHNQLITTFGPGSIVDAVKDSCHGSGLELLEGKRKENYRWQIGLISGR